MSMNKPWLFPVNLFLVEIQEYKKEENCHFLSKILGDKMTLYPIYYV